MTGEADDLDLCQLSERHNASVQRSPSHSVKSMPDTSTPGSSALSVERPP
jgi:hypothetical protein